MDSRKLKIVIGVLITVVAAGLAVVTIVCSNRNNSYDDYTKVEDNTGPLMYNEKDSLTMLDKANAVIDQFSEELAERGIQAGPLTEEMISYTYDTSKVTVVYNLGDYDIYLFIQFDDNNNVEYYEITSSDESGENQEAG